MIVLVSGSRTINTEQELAIERKFERLNNTDEAIILIHGNAPGVDTFAAKYATHLHWSTMSFPADWKQYGRAAGPLRNQKMVDTICERAGNNAKIRVCAFPNEKSRGTWDLVNRARLTLQPRFKDFELDIIPVGPLP